MKPAPLLSGDTLGSALDDAVRRLPAALMRPPPLPVLLRSVQCFTRSLADGQFAAPLSAIERKQLMACCDGEYLRSKLERALGEDPFTLRRPDYRQARFAAWRSLGCVLHVMDREATLPAFLGVLDGLLAGNVNWVHVGRGDWPIVPLLEALLGCDGSGLLADHVSIWPLADADLKHLLPHVAGVLADQDDRTLQSHLHAGCPWLTRSRKSNFIYLAAAAFEIDPGEQCALVERIIERACREGAATGSRGFLVLVDSDDTDFLRTCGARLARAFAVRAGDDAGAPGPHEASLPTDEGAVAQADRNSVASSSGGWRVLWQRGGAFELPAARTLVLRTLRADALCQGLLPWRGQLHSCSLVCAPNQLAGLTMQLLAAGVACVDSRCNIDGGELIDQEHSLTQLAQLTRRVSADLSPASLVGQAMLEGSAGDAHVPELLASAAQLFLRPAAASSSASCYGHYRAQVRMAADGLYAAGLDPRTDRVLNLLPNQHQGAMLSSFLILERLDAVHFPGTGPGLDSHDAVVDLIVQHHINALIGSPSTIYQLYLSAQRRLRAYGRVQKAFLSNDHVSAEQRRFLCGFGMVLIDTVPMRP